MNKTEKVALRESMIIVLMGAVINFPSTDISPYG